MNYEEALKTAYELIGNNSVEILTDFDWMPNKDNLARDIAKEIVKTWKFGYIVAEEDIACQEATSQGY